MARLVPGYEERCASNCTGHVVGSAETEEEGGCGSTNGRSTGGEMAKMEESLLQNEVAEVEGRETEITLPKPKAAILPPLKTTRQNERKAHLHHVKRSPPKQKMGQCEKCGYLSSQKMCKACVLLEGLNKNNPKVSMHASPPDEISEHESLEEKLLRSMAHMG
jgi:cytoplasmic tRNA 2-thiolation protein 1